MSSSTPAGADASRPRSGVLTPTSGRSSHKHNRGLPSSSESRKRRIEDSIAMDYLLKPSITVKPHPTTWNAHPFVLQPLMLILRQHLPLSAIDFSDPTGPLPSSRLFESHVKVLDLESRMGACTSILVARSESSSASFAIERAGSGLYTICKLGPWLALDDLAKNASIVCEDRIRPAKKQAREEHVSNTVTTYRLHKEHKKKTAAIEAIQDLVRKKVKVESLASDEFVNDSAVEQAVETQTAEFLQSAGLDTLTQIPLSITESEQTVTLPSVGAEEEISHRTADLLFDNIRTQYFEALYKSKGSLAYFAKGPLSRARSTFRLDLESNLDVADLVEFLRGLILTTVQIDKKYRDTIPAIISKLATTIDSSDDGRKKRKPTKMKIRKDGLYPVEHDLIGRWWSENKPELKEDQAAIPAAEIKSHTSLLRTRETQLQMIVILETLALESARMPDTDSNLPDLPGLEQSQGGVTAPTPKKRTKHNLRVLIDVLADRLTIWQSTATDELLLLEDSQVPAQTSPAETSQMATSEPLKDFCVDVVLPFFSARLPDMCNAINRKLGGPVILSPPKPKHKKSSKRDGKPGTAAKRPFPAKAPRTLQRALSTDIQHQRSVSRGPINVIALMRSATTTAVPGFKREESEPASQSDTATTNHGRPGHRSSLSRSNSTSNLKDGKTTRNATVDAELRDAISMLRKPNREVVGKALAEAAERRSTTETSLKRFKKSQLGASNTSTTIKATPANNRFRNALSSIPTALDSIPIPSTEEAIPPSSIGPHVPSTAQGNSYRDLLGSGNSSARLVGATPVRKTSSSNFLVRSAALHEPAIPPSSPLNERQHTNNSTPNSFSNLVGKLDFTSVRKNMLLETPVRKPAQVLDLGGDNDDQPRAEIRGQGRKPSIYERLGWDEEFDDL